MLNLFVYLAFLGCLTGFIASFPVCKMYDTHLDKGSSVNDSSVEDDVQHECNNLQVTEDLNLNAL
jgi:hypothetical protein